MRDRRPRLRRLVNDPFANGLVLVAVALFVVFVAYTANNGIPAQPVYRVSIDVPDASQLVKHADVRVGGGRVGQVLRIHPVPRHGTQAPYARLDLALKTDLRPLPVDTGTEVRVASVLGGKYIALTPGRSERKLRKGQVLPLSRARPSVDIDTAFRVFNPATIHALQQTVIALGNGLLGRGTALNDSISSLAESAPAAQRVLALLADPSTRLGPLLASVADTVRALRPVAGRLTSLVGDGATTFAAVNAAGDSFRQTLDALPPAISHTTTTLRHLRPALDQAAALADDLRPAVGVLRPTALHVDQILRQARPVARDIPGLLPSLRKTFRGVDALTGNRPAIDAFHVLGTNDLGTVGGSGVVGLGGILKSVSEGQLNCDVLGRWTRNLAALSGDGDRTSSWLRVGLILDPSQMTHDAQPADDLHLNAYPREDAGGCESGTEKYVPGRVIGSPARGTAHVYTAGRRKQTP